MWHFVCRLPQQSASHMWLLSRIYSPQIHSVCFFFSFFFSSRLFYSQISQMLGNEIKFAVREPMGLRWGFLCQAAVRGHQPHRVKPIKWSVWQVAKSNVASLPAGCGCSSALWPSLSQLCWWVKRREIQSGLCCLTSPWWWWRGKKMPLHALLQTERSFLQKNKGRSVKSGCCQFSLDLSFLGASGETAASLSATSQMLDLSVQRGLAESFLTHWQEVFVSAASFFSVWFVRSVGRGVWVVIWGGQNPVVPDMTALRCASVSSHRRWFFRSSSTRPSSKRSSPPSKSLCGFTARHCWVSWKKEKADVYRSYIGYIDSECSMIETHILCLHYTYNWLGPLDGAASCMLCVLMIQVWFVWIGSLSLLGFWRWCERRDNDALDFT